MVLGKIKVYPLLFNNFQEPIRYRGQMACAEHCLSSQIYCSEGEDLLNSQGMTVQWDLKHPQV